VGRAADGGVKRRAAGQPKAEQPSKKKASGSGDAEASTSGSGGARGSATKADWNKYFPHLSHAQFLEHVDTQEGASNLATARQVDAGFDVSMYPADAHSTNRFGRRFFRRFEVLDANEYKRVMLKPRAKKHPAVPIIRGPCEETGEEVELYCFQSSQHPHRYVDIYEDQSNDFVTTKLDGRDQKFQDHAQQVARSSFDEDARSSQTALLFRPDALMTVSECKAKVTGIALVPDVGVHGSSASPRVGEGSMPTSVPRAPKSFRGRSAASLDEDVGIVTPLRPMREASDAADALLTPIGGVVSLEARAERHGDPIVAPSVASAKEDDDGNGSSSEDGNEDPSSGGANTRETPFEKNMKKLGLQKVAGSQRFNRRLLTFAEDATKTLSKTEAATLKKRLVEVAPHFLSLTRSSKGVFCMFHNSIIVYIFVLMCLCCGFRLMGPPILTSGILSRIPPKLPGGYRGPGIVGSQRRHLLQPHCS
jgi:hypothetical protein